MKDAVELAIQSIRIVGWSLHGCSECPFSSEYKDAYGETDINISDPDEGHYDCSLLKKQKIWGENPGCKDSDWVEYVKTQLELSNKQAGIREVVEWIGSNAIFKYLDDHEKWQDKLKEWGIKQ